MRYSAGTGIVLAILSRGIHSLSGELAIAGSACYAAVIAIGLPTCVRINKQGARWAVQSPPDDWTLIRASWVRFRDGPRRYPLTHMLIQAGIAHNAQMLLGPSNKLDLVSARHLTVTQRCSSIAASFVDGIPNAIHATLSQKHELIHVTSVS